MLDGLIRQFIDDLKRQRLRTMLTVLGITWGTVAVVVLLAFGTGMGRQMRKNAAGIGEAIVIVSGGTTTKSFAGFPDGRRIQLDEDDAALLKREIPEILYLSGEYGRWTPVRRGTAAANPWVTGVWPEYGEIRNVFPDAGGRWIHEQDMAGRRRVAVLGDSLKKLLFGAEDAVGQYVHINGTPFLVVGVMRPKTQNASYRARDRDRVFIPATTFRSVFGDRYLSRLILKAKDPDLTRDAVARMYKLLGRRYRFDPTDRDALSVWDTTEFQRILKYMFLGFNIFLGVVGSFTLIVGGIGVANIMYVVVRERTPEIGLKRSLGATRRLILTQVMVETLLIVAVGAVLGLLISFGLVEAGSMLPAQDEIGRPELSPAVLAATIALLALVGLLAGWFPARRAASLDPVECLRFNS